MIIPCPIPKTSKLPVLEDFCFLLFDNFSRTVNLKFFIFSLYCIYTQQNKIHKNFAKLNRCNPKFIDRIYNRYLIKQIKYKNKNLIREKKHGLEYLKYKYNKPVEYLMTAYNHTNYKMVYVYTPFPYNTNNHMIKNE